MWSECGVTMNLSNELAIKLLLSTGQRVQEVLNAEWSEFDLTNGVWTIPFEKRKNRFSAEHSEPHIVPLAPLHIRLLDELKPLAEESRWVFPNGNRDAPRSYNSVYQAIGRFYKNKQRAIPFAKFTTRDLRRTFKTLAGMAGLSKEIRDRIQGHAFHDVGSRNYDRYDYLPQKTKAMLAWSDWLKTTISGGSAKIIMLDDKRMP